MTNKEKKAHTNLSKLLSLILRHKPQTIGIELSKDGWTDTTVLIQKINEHGYPLNFETLVTIVETNNKKRFAFNEDRSKIRANQGHSLKVDLEYQPKSPPAELYHGTAEKYLDSIYETGLEKRNRLHVHLSKDVETAYKVGEGHGKPVTLKILAKQMHANGFVFYESDNGVWLTDEVPVKYIRELN